MVAVIAFWASVAVLAYGYAGFPLLVSAVGRIRDRRVRQAPVTPSVSLIIAAYNEEAGIHERVENALRADYPEDALEIIVASDGSTDGTEAIVSRFDPERVRLLPLPRRGKAHALNEAVRRSRGDVLVFSDANTLFEPDALRTLVRGFADPDVGGVAGHTGYVISEEGEASGRGETLYWRYDTWLKRLESRTGSVVSAHGGMYAIRRELFQPIEDPAVTDDFAISTAVVEQGRRLVFEPEARGYEMPVDHSGREFQRRVRLMTRGLRGVLVLRRHLLDPRRYGFYSLLLFSHKVLRRALPLVLPVTLVSSIALSSRGTVYLGAAVAQAVFYALAVAGHALRGSAMGRWKIFYVPFFFCMANLASLVALWNVVRGRRIDRWNPQRHEPETTGPAGNGQGDLTTGPAPEAERTPESGRRRIPEGWQATLLDEVEMDLHRRRLRYSVLRRPGAGGSDEEAPPGFDVLVHPDDASDLEKRFLAHDFLRLPPASAAFRSHLVGRATWDGAWVQLNVRTELLYGRPVPCLRTREPADRILRRRARREGVSVLAPDDELLDLLLHSLLDRGRIPDATARRVEELIDELLRCPPLAGRAAERIQFELAPAITWERLLLHVRKGEWAALARRRNALALRLARSEPGRAAGRLAVGSRSLLSGPPFGALTNRGRIAALLSPDGGGKSTVARSLVRSSPATTRVVHGGYPERVRHLPSSVHRTASFWWRALQIRWLRAAGYLVIVDRYVFDGWVGEGGLDPRRRSWKRRILEWPFPRPDLVVVLDAPGKELHRRTGERCPEVFEEQRRAYASLRERIPGVVVVDASRPHDDVFEAVSGYLWSDDRRLTARQRWTG